MTLVCLLIYTSLVTMLIASITLKEIGSESELKTKFYDKRDNFNFPIVNFPFSCICRNIPASPDTLFSELLVPHS
jgi:hypothetical protein